MSGIRSCLMAPIINYIDIFFHEKTRESVILRISDYAAIAFGALGCAGVLFSSGLGIKYIVDLGTDFAFSFFFSVSDIALLTKEGFDVSILAQAGASAVALKVSLCVTVVALILYGVSLIARDLLHRQVSNQSNNG